jgi:hypothetical protein
MERVLGIGGYFVRAADPAALGAWYRECLGLDADQNGLWQQGAGPTVFATFDRESDYFGSRAQQTMLNSACVTSTQCSRNCAARERTWRRRPKTWRASAGSGG